MAATTIRLGTLARVLEQTGQIALRDGVELRTLSLTVPVGEPPVLDPQRLWRIAIAAPRSHWWQRWSDWLTRQLGLGRAPDWPLVRLVWCDGTVFAELERNQTAR